ncbi:MAG TPA: hypothetical protein VFF76_00395 [Holophagaceae bacterium]|jgi:hypothetical protein|nr:hypothetical protein [Holophagaceae bacterium]
MSIPIKRVQLATSAKPLEVKRAAMPTKKEAPKEPEKSLEAEAGAVLEEVSAKLTGFHERQEKEKLRAQLATDSEFWIAVSFKSREQKEAFLKAIQMDARLHGDKYLLGEDVAHALKIPLPHVELPKIKRRFDPDYLKLAMD